MRFSIIIPAHNSAGFIRAALDSIKAQTFTDYELIVVCDSCTDDTRAVAEEYGARTLAVDYHRDGLTRNAGIDVATGEYILFMDDDDRFVHPFVLEMLNGRLSGEDVLCFGFYWKGRGYTSPTGNRGGLWIAVWNKCWRRSFIGDTRFGDEWSISDIGFHNRCMAKRPMLNTWEQCFYYYNYMRVGSITETDTRAKDGGTV